MTQHTITFAVRNLGNITILIGAFSANATDMAPCPSAHFSEISVQGGLSSLDIKLSKGVYPIKNSLVPNIKLYSLSELATCHIWSLIVPDDNKCLHGKVAYLDTLLLQDESESTQRKLFFTVLANNSHAITTEEHGVYHGLLKKDDDRALTFTVKRDTGFALDKFTGEALKGLLRALTFTNADGTDFVIDNDMPQEVNKVRNAAINELIATSSFSDKTTAQLRENGLFMYFKEEEYCQFLIEMHKRTSLLAKKQKNLLSKNEDQELEAIIKEYVSNQ